MERRPDCKSPACTRESVTKGFCPGHYQRFIKGQDTDTPLRVYKPREPKLDVDVSGAGRRPKRKSSGVPDLHFDSVMKPFKDQQVAIDKLSKVTCRLCADSMGVGKTVTGIGLDFETRKKPGYEQMPTLIIAEKIGIDVWHYHLRAMGVPESQILLINPSDRTEFEQELAYLAQYQARRGPRPAYRYYVMHCDVLIRLPILNAKRGKHPKIRWGHIIADEVHLYKNRKAKRTICLKRTAGDHKTGLSGTPADDKPWDIWSVLHWLYPVDFRSYWDFYEDHVQYISSSEVGRYRKWIKNGGDYDSYREKYPTAGNGYRTEVGLKDIPQLHRIIAPFYIRRTLLEVAPDMPEKVHVMPAIVVPMGSRQRREYDEMAEKALTLIGTDTDGDGGFELLAPAQIAVLTRLQQMSLATLSPEWNISETEFVGDEDEMEWDLPDIVLSKPSPKLDAVINLIETHETEPFVVFTQFRGMADLVEEECQRLKIPVVKIHGGIHSKNVRTDLVRQFQDGEARVFVGTIAAAGKTITLTRANHVIFTDLSWNPSKNEQAEDRLWRRTQRNTVRVYHIQSEDSIDQVRFDKIRTKGQMIDVLLNPRGKLVNRRKEVAM